MLSVTVSNLLGRKQASTQPTSPKIQRTNTYSSHHEPHNDVLSDSPFLAAFLTASPFAAELISLLDTVSKQRLFMTCAPLYTYRDSCYAWQSVTLTKHGYHPETCFSKLNYQIQARLFAPKRYIPLPDEFSTSNSSSMKSSVAKGVMKMPVENYFVKELDDGKIWDMFGVRPGFGTVLKDLVLDGTSVTMPLVVKILTICKVNGKGLKSLSLRYCEKIRFEEVMELVPKKIKFEDENEDSGFESQGDSEDEKEEEEEDSLLRTLKELQLYGIRNLHLASQEHKRWLVDIDRFFKYTTDKSIRTDIGWCSQTLAGGKKRQRRIQCHGGRDLPFIRVLPLADTGSVRSTHCIKCKKGPEAIGWHCDTCLKDVLCECCGTFLCDNCDPQRRRLVKCGDCPARRCMDCFKKNGGITCAEAACKGRTTCGEHNLEISCNTCSESKVVSCSSCNPARRCQKCSNWIYDHCEPDRKKSFSCECDFELCEDCCESAKQKFSEKNIVDGSLEEIVYAIDSSEYPIVPKIFKGMNEAWLEDNENWCCFYCRIMPRRRERFMGPKARAASTSRLRR